MPAVGAEGSCATQPDVASNGVTARNASTRERTTLAARASASPGTFTGDNTQAAASTECDPHWQNPVQVSVSAPAPHLLPPSSPPVPVDEGHMQRGTGGGGGERREGSEPCRIFSITALCPFASRFAHNCSNFHTIHIFHLLPRVKASSFQARSSRSRRRTHLYNPLLHLLFRCQHSHPIPPASDTIVIPSMFRPDGWRHVNSGILLFRSLPFPIHFGIFPPAAAMIYSLHTISNRHLSAPGDGPFGARRVCRFLRRCTFGDVRDCSSSARRTRAEIHLLLQHASIYSWLSLCPIF